MRNCVGNSHRGSKRRWGLWGRPFPSRVLSESGNRVFVISVGCCGERVWLGGCVDFILSGRLIMRSDRERWRFGGYILGHEVGFIEEGDFVIVVPNY